MRIKKMLYVDDIIHECYEYIQPPWEKVELIVMSLSLSQYIVLCIDDEESEMIYVYSDKKGYFIEYLHDFGGDYIKLYPILSPNAIGCSSKISTTIDVSHKLYGTYDDAKEIIWSFYENGARSLNYKWTNNIKYGIK